MSNQEYTAGQVYHLDLATGQALINAMGTGKVLMDGPLDFGIGRRYDGDGQWTLWTVNGQKINVAITSDGGFVAGFGEIDPDRPEPQFSTMAALQKAAQRVVSSLAQARNLPRKCIKPGCENLVAPVGVKKPEPGIFKNYAATGACQKGHNGYFCDKCQRPHSYASQLGKDHLPLSEYAEEQA